MDDPKPVRNLVQLLPPPKPNIIRKAPTSDSIVRALKSIADKNESPVCSWNGPRSVLCVRSQLQDSEKDLNSVDRNIDPDNAAAVTSADGEQDASLNSLASRLFSVMSGTATTQAVIYSGFSGSGKTFASTRVTEQLLELSFNPSPKLSHLPSQIKALHLILHSFGQARSTTAPSASQVSTLFEMHFAPPAGKKSAAFRLVAGKVITFGLNKSRVVAHKHSEGSFNIFYQLLAGASAHEREIYGLRQDLADYRTMRDVSNSHLGDHEATAKDRMAFEDLLQAMAIVGIQYKQQAAICRVLSAILLLTNITFDGNVAAMAGETAWIESESQADLQVAAALLDLSAEDLESKLVNKTRYIRKECIGMILTPNECASQRDTLCASLYGMLFAFIVESANTRIFPGEDAVVNLMRSGGASIVQLDIPGSDLSLSNSPNRNTSLIETIGEQSHSQFCQNICQDMLQSFLTNENSDEQSFERSNMLEDALDVSPCDYIDPSLGRMELLRGGALGSRADSRPGGLVGGLAKACRDVQKGRLQASLADATFADNLRESCRTSPYFSGPNFADGELVFGIQHFGSHVSYSAQDFVEDDADLLDVDLLAMLRSSEDAFIARLFSGPGLAVETHHIQASVPTQAQVMSASIRNISPLATVYGMIDGPSIASSGVRSLCAGNTTALASILSSLKRCNLWTVQTLSSNRDSASCHWDLNFVKAQVEALAIPQHVIGAADQYLANVTHAEVFKISHVDVASGEAVKSFCDRHKLTLPRDLATGRHRVWLGVKVWQKLLPGFTRKETKGDDQAQQERLNAARVSVDLIRAQSRLDLDKDSLKSLSSEEKDGSSPGLAVGELPYLSDKEVEATKGTQFADVYDYLLKQPQSANPFESPKTSASELTPESHLYNNEKQGKEDDRLGFGEETVEVESTTRSRRLWLAIVWTLTFWMPTFLLKWNKSLQRPDVRMAFREKVAICALILLACAFVIFYIVAFGLLLCPEYNFVWNSKELGYHQGRDDYWVAVRGRVYDLTDFWRTQHSDIPNNDSDDDDMLALAGQDLTNYFPIPLNIACPNLVSANNLVMQYATWNPSVPSAVHTSSHQQPVTSSALHEDRWYYDDFLPFMKPYYKGPLVFTRGNVTSQAKDTTNGKQWAVYKNGIYDLSDYFSTIEQLPGYDAYEYLGSPVADLFQSRPGQDITSAIDNLSEDRINGTYKADTLDCIQTLFYVGQLDPGETPRCLTQPYLLLAFSAILIAVMLIKFLSALQFGSRRLPESRDKFIILQVPCYTEGDESLRKTFQSLAVLEYDDKRKLLVCIVDGNIVGSGNDRTTPKIVLDILGHSERADAVPLMFKSIGEGSAQLNYGKVYSGLFEHEGHILPYLVVAKCGKPSERHRPGNRGKRDSQILMMRFLNRLHNDKDCYPLELEMHHQIKNVIGVDPSLYEFMLCVDADTEVAPDSLSHLVAVAHSDQKIIGLCGETKVANQYASLTTLIQPFEYFISHHMAKSFESLFGSVTCLPGCFTLYRIKSAEGKPLLVADSIIDDYSENHVDTLHKKNLLSLGEDRYLTTLLLKHFPTYKTKFTQDALAYTVVPDKWSVLLSQRRRWINSTVHNLVELSTLKNLCGACCFSMRFIVMLDLIGTVILPATTVYIVYLIVQVSSHRASVPTFSLLMLGAVYGLQVLLFLLKREWQFIAWLILYLAAYPIYSFFLPLYSFWHMDDFSWGNTRVVTGEGKTKRILAADQGEEAFDESVIPKTKIKDYQSQAWNDLEAHTQPNLSPANNAFQLHSGISPMQRHMPRASSYGSMLSMPLFDASRANSPFYATGFTPVHSPMNTPLFYPARSVAGSIHGGSPFANNNNFADMSQSPATQSYFDAVPRASPRGLSHSPVASQHLGSAFQQSRRASNVSAFGSQSQLNLKAEPISGLPHTSPSADPSDEEITQAVQRFLSQQDLDHVTKRSTREAMTQYFAKADLSTRKSLINHAIEAFCQMP